MKYPEYNTLNPNHCREIYIKTNYKEFHQYLISNYPEELSFGEKLYWFYNNITERPKCLICGKPVKFMNALNGYCKYCSKKCSNSSEEKKTKTKQTNKIKFGGNAPACSKDVLIKMKQTNLERHGDENFNNRESASKTMIERYGGIGNASEVIKSKQQKTMIDKYGKDNSMFIDDIKDKMRSNNMEKYGVEWVTQDRSVLDKITATKRKNKTFSTSKIEKQFEAYLKENNINYKTQYKSEVYPFNCDFYFPDYDLYLEIQGSWTHGYRPFNPSNNNDQIQLLEWQSKNNKFYNSAINIWTVRDVLKRETAKKNNLNFIEVFTTNINVLIDEYKRAIKGL